MKQTGILMAAACAVMLAAAPVLAQQYDKPSSGTKSDQKSERSATPRIQQPGGEGTSTGTGTSAGGGTGPSTGGGTGTSAGANTPGGTSAGVSGETGTSKSGAPAGTLMQKREKGMSHGASDATGKTTQ
jgi:hypothetical protein